MSDIEKSNQRSGHKEWRFILSKKKFYYKEAERLYIQENLGIEEIALRLKLGERTIRYWKEGNDWNSKKKNYLDSKSVFHQELYDFSRDLMHSIRNDMKNGEKIEPGRMFAFARLLPLIIKVKEYEEVVSKNGAKEDNKGLTEEVITRIQEEILGMKPKRSSKECN